MGRNTPIGCRSFHYTRNINGSHICFYCNKEITKEGLNFSKIDLKGQYEPGSFLDALCVDDLTNSKSIIGVVVRPDKTGTIITNNPNIYLEKIMRKV